MELWTANSAGPADDEGHRDVVRLDSERASLRRFAPRNDGAVQISTREHVMLSRKPAKARQQSVTVKEATLRPAARVRHQEGIRQSRLDRTAVPERLARRHRLRAGPAGSHRDRHGRRLRAGHPQRRLRQSAFGGRRRQRARQHLHRASQPDAAGDHGGAAGALDPAAAGVPSMPSAPRNFRGPMSNTASSRRAPKTCRPQSHAPITWRCSRPAVRPLYPCRSTTGRGRRKPSRPATSAVRSARIRQRCGR